MLIILLSTQILLNSPYRHKLTDDSLNGRPLEISETLIQKGKVSLNILGEYIPNSASILINGVIEKNIDVFPLELDVSDGDVVELEVKKHTDSFYVYLSSRDGAILTDMKASTILVKPGINYILKVLTSREN